MPTGQFHRDSMQTQRDAGLRIRILCVLVLLVSAACASSFIGQNGLAAFHWDDCEYLFSALDTFDAVTTSGYISWPSHIVAKQHYGKPPLYVNLLAVALTIFGRDRLVAAVVFTTGITVVTLGLLVYGLIASFAGPARGILATIAVLGMPAVGVWATQAYPDLQLTCMVVAVFWLITIDLESRRRALYLGLSLGLGMLAKTTFPIFVALPLLYWALYDGAGPKDRHSRLGTLALASLIGACVASIWYLTNFREAIGYAQGAVAVVAQPDMARKQRLWNWLRVLTVEGLGYGLIAVGLMASVSMWLRRVSGRRGPYSRFTLLALLGGLPMAILSAASTTPANGRHPLPSLVLLGLALLVLIFKAMDDKSLRRWSGIAWLVVITQWVLTSAIQIPALSARMKESPANSYLQPFAPGLRDLSFHSWTPVREIVRRTEHYDKDGLAAWYFYGDDGLLNVNRLQLEGKVARSRVEFQYTCLAAAADCEAQLESARRRPAMVVAYFRPWEQTGGEAADWNRHSRMVKAMLESPANGFRSSGNLEMPGYSVQFYQTQNSPLRPLCAAPEYASFGGQLQLTHVGVEGKILFLKLKRLSVSAVDYKLLLRARPTGSASPAKLLWDAYIQPPVTSLQLNEYRIFSFLLPEEAEKRRFDLDVGFFDERDSLHNWPPLKLPSGEATLNLDAEHLYTDRCACVAPRNEIPTRLTSQ